MKEKIIEQDGLLFVKCEPEPLEKNSIVPCLVRLIQDNSRIGMLNKANYPEYALGISVMISKSTEYVNIYMHPSLYPETIHYSQLEVIAKHCPEPEIVKPEVGEWYKLNDDDIYMLCKNCFDDFSSFRLAGNEYKEGGYRVYKEDYYRLTPTSLVPDFSNAKEKDIVYSVAEGRMVEIDDVDYDAYGNIRLRATKQNCYLREFNYNGMASCNSSPTFFESLSQCSAYFAELDLLEKRRK